MLSHVKEEKTSGLKDKAMRDTRKLQESLKWVRKQRQEMEEELADLKMKKWPLYCPQGSGTLRQQLLMMHGIAFTA